MYDLNETFPKPMGMIGDGIRRWGPQSMAAVEKIGGLIGLCFGMCFSPTWVVLYWVLTPYVNMEILLEGGQSALLEYFSFMLTIAQEPVLGLWLLLPLLSCAVVNLFYLALCRKVGTWLVVRLLCESTHEESPTHVPA